jgi:hypothetical protein
MLYSRKEGDIPEQINNYEESNDNNFMMNHYNALFLDDKDTRMDVERGSCS